MPQARFVFGCGRGEAAASMLVLLVENRYSSGRTRDDGNTWKRSEKNHSQELEILRSIIFYEKLGDTQIIRDK
jgi:hypothetical protein